MTETIIDRARAAHETENAARQRQRVVMFEQMRRQALTRWAAALGGEPPAESEWYLPPGEYLYRGAHVVADGLELRFYEDPGRTGSAGFEVLRRSDGKWLDVRRPADLGRLIEFNGLERFLASDVADDDDDDDDVYLGDDPRYLTLRVEIAPNSTDDDVAELCDALRAAGWTNIEVTGDERG